MLYRFSYRTFSWWLKTWVFILPHPPPIIFVSAVQLSSSFVRKSSLKEISRNGSFQRKFPPHVWWTIWRWRPLPRMPFMFNVSTKWNACWNDAFRWVCIFYYAWLTLLVCHHVEVWLLQVRGWRCGGPCRASLNMFSSEWCIGMGMGMMPPAGSPVGTTALCSMPSHQAFSFPSFFRRNKSFEYKNIRPILVREASIVILPHIFGSPWITKLLLSVLWTPDTTRANFGTMGIGMIPVASMPHG